MGPCGDFSLPGHDWFSLVPGLFAALGAVLGTTALATGDASGVQRPADDVIAHSRKVLDATATDQHQGVLLQVVSLTGNVGGDLHSVGETYTSDLPERRVRLLRSRRVHADTDAALLGTVLEGGCRGLPPRLLPGVTY